MAANGEVTNRDPIIEEYLRKRFAAPSAAEAEIDRARFAQGQGLQDSMDAANFMQAMQGAADKFGSIGGVVPKSNMDFLDKANQSRAQQMAQIEKDQARDEAEKESGKKAAIEEYLRSRRQGEQWAHDEKIAGMKPKKLNEISGYVDEKGLPVFLKEGEESKGYLTADGAPAKGVKKYIAPEKPKPTDYNAKLAGLNASDKARFDNVRMYSTALDDMEKAIKKGGSRYSLIGDNEFTKALDRAAEAFGRMQSGGAINKDEEARFKNMVRATGDDTKMTLQKIADNRKEAHARLTTLGFSPQEVPEIVSSASELASVKDVSQSDGSTAFAKGAGKSFDELKVGEEFEQNGHMWKKTQSGADYIGPKKGK